MTVTSQVDRNDYEGDGATDTYAFTFPIKATTELQVYIGDAEGDDDALTLGVDFTATISSNGQGTITLTAGDLADETPIVIKRGIPYTQEVDPTASGAYSPRNAATALDRLAMQIIRLKGDVDRCIKLPHLEAGGDSATKLPSVADRAGNTLIFDVSGNVRAGDPVGTGSGSGGSLGTSVKASPYLAEGDGSTDDTDAIQACIDAVYAAGGGVVYFPAGTYIVRVAQTASATWKHCLTIYPNITLRGENKENTTIKLIDSAGNYRSIIARSANGLTDMHNFGMYDLTVDQNNDNNAPALLTDLTTNGGARHVVLCFGGRRSTIKNCNFIGCKNINTVVFNAPVGLCGDILIDSCRFVMATSASINNDHSSIYTSADRVVISNNIFESPVLKNYGSRTAIETHGNEHTVFGNVINKFSTGCNLTGVAFESDNVVFFGNTITQALYGVVIWSWFISGNLTEPGLRNCRISGNSITIDREGWDGHIGTSIASGIYMESTGQAPIHGLVISENTIEFLEDSSAGAAEDVYASGITMLRTLIGADGFDRDIIISKNTIRNAIACGIDLRTSCVGLKVVDNIITNPGQSLFAISNSFRSGVLVFPIGTEIQESWEVSRNHFIDDQATPTMIAGISTSNVTAVNCHCIDNVWHVPNRVLGVNRAYIGTAGTNTGWIHRWAGPGFIPTDYLIGPMRAGSIVIDSDTGIRYVEYITPEGGGFIGEVPNLCEAGRVPFGRLDGSGGLDDAADVSRPSAGQFIVGSTAQAGTLWVNAPAAGSCGVRWAHENLQRFLLFTAGAGADLGLAAYTDLAAFIDYPIFIRRASGERTTFNRPMDLQAGFTPKRQTVSADTTLNHTDVIVAYSGTGGHTLTAPAANVLGSGRPWMQWVANNGTGPVSYARAGSDTIDGNTAAYILWPGESALFCGDGSSTIYTHGAGGSHNRIITRTLEAVNLNSAATDVGTFARLPGKYRVRRLTVTNASISLTTATFSLRTQAAGAGTAIVNDQALAALTAAEKVTEPTLAVTDSQTAVTLVLRCNTAQGAAATADFILELESLVV